MERGDQWGRSGSDGEWGRSDGERGPAGEE